jgi:hypothetical protein
MHTTLEVKMSLAYRVQCAGRGLLLRHVFRQPFLDNIHSWHFCRIVVPACQGLYCLLLCRLQYLKSRLERLEEELNSEREHRKKVRKRECEIPDVGAGRGRVGGDRLAALLWHVARQMSPARAAGLQCEGSRQGRLLLAWLAVISRCSTGMIRHVVPHSTCRHCLITPAGGAGLEHAQDRADQQQVTNSRRELKCWRHSIPQYDRV